MKKLLTVLLTSLGVMTLAGCPSQADVASQNLSTAADNFQIERRIVFYNTVDSSYMMSIEGRCALGNADKNGELSVTCMTGPGTYKKHFLGLSRNVTYFVEQMDNAGVSPYHYKIIFRPETIIPDLSIQ